MIQYRRILELHFKGTSQRTISSSVGNSRQTASDVIKKAKDLGLVELTDYFAPSSPSVSNTSPPIHEWSPSLFLM
jgi:DNA-binding transcriptional regulator LsrR (DeoR family)